jgi:predicted hotdog family 3-hydroxylacyl-ACP dehydratase
MLDAVGIAARVPHALRMCLLERLERWDDDVIVCSASNHRELDHPLRSASGLLATVAIEYAAQAMALHGGLVAERSDPQSTPRPGFIAAVRGVVLHVARLDTLDSALTVQATRVVTQGDSVIYAFDVRSGSTRVAEGRATVVLNTPVASRVDAAQSMPP